MQKLSVRICVLQRVVQAIAISVEALAIVGLLHVVVGREEAAEQRVVEAAVHINQAIFGQHFVAGVAALECNGVRTDRGLAPDVVGGFVEPDA